VDFPYLVRIFCVEEITSLISLEKKSEGRWWATHFLLTSSSHGAVGAPICLPRESKHSMLVRVADRWTKPPFSTRVAPVADGS
jgi:hypothetical protein